MLDRAYQLHLLTMIRGTYPVAFDIRQHMRELDDKDMRKFEYNLAYLVEHRLIDCQISTSVNGHISMGMPRITKDGLDFLEDDGGLSAILNITTIKLHQEDLRQLLEAKISASTELKPEEKKTFVSQLRALPADATKQLVIELMKRGLDHGPDAWQYIRTLLGG